MPATLPTVRGSIVALYPVVRGNQINCAVQKFLNASEQRFKRAVSLGRFQLAYTGLNATDRDALKAFYATVKGSFDSTWSFTLVNTYTTCIFEEDAFTSVEGNRPLLYDVTLKFRQTIKGGAVSGAGTSFPALSTGARSQRPYTQIVRYRTSVNAMPTGPSHSFPWFAGGLSGFPTRGLMGWKLQFPSISDADMATLEAHFVAMNGRYQTFSFTDPDSGTVYTNVRYDQDVFEYRYLDKNHASTTITLAETN